jgi:hypothetical protein
MVRNPDSFDPSGVYMQVEEESAQTPGFRLDVPLHSLLTKPAQAIFIL